MRRALVLALLAAVPHAVAAQQPQTPAPMPPSAAPPSAAAAPAYPVKGSGTVVLRAARLIDGTGAAPVQNAVVVVTDDRIVAVGREGVVAVPAGARVVDLGDATLLPGFIDMHTHIIGRTLADPASDVASVRDYASYGAILATDNARRTLMAGFTTIRNLGAPNFDDMALRQAIDAGVVAGPRMQTAGHSFGITGGHCDDNGWRPGLADNDYRSGVADGADEVRKAVRYQAKYGADVLKICATGGVLSEGDAVGTTQYTLDEMRAAVDEAHKLDERRVAAHAHGAEGIKLAVRAGVASIEHGSFLDEEGARLMAQRGTYLVPTLMAGETVENAAKGGRLTGLRRDKALAAARAMRNSIRLAARLNVPIAFGTDAGVGAHGANAREFRLLVDWGGLTPMQALVAGDGDPLRDISATERVTMVMKGGVVYKMPASGGQQAAMVK